MNHEDKIELLTELVWTHGSCWLQYSKKGQKLLLKNDLDDSTVSDFRQADLLATSRLARKFRAHNLKENIPFKCFLVGHLELDPGNS